MNADPVAVVGSANLDVVLFLERFAGPGETVLGSRLEHVAGGKGLNQAVAAARTTGCSFVGCVGDDEAGDVLRARLAHGHVDLRHLSTVHEATGRAFIQVTSEGENSIVVMPLSNRSLSPDMVTTALDRIQPAVVLSQLEVPLESVQAAADWSSAHGARFVLNPSPVAPLPAELLRRCDPLVLNVGEAATYLTGRADAAADGSPTHPVTAALRLLDVAASAVVTAGPAGAAAATPADGAVHIEGIARRPVDTTGAGDEFAGALASALARGAPLHDATRVANEAAARVIEVPRALRD